MKKFGEQSAILHDAYFNKPPCLIRLFLIRLVLLCGLSASAMAALTDLYLMNGENQLILIITAAATAIICILATILPSAAVYIVSFGVYCTAFLREEVREKLIFFYDFFILRINGRLLKTEDFTYHTLSALRSGVYADEIAEGREFGFIMLGILVALLFVMLSRTRFRPFYTMLVFIILAAPAFASEIAGYHDSLGVFAAFYFAFYAVRIAYELDGLFVFEKPRISNEATRRNEKSYRRRMFFSAFGRKIKGDIPRYFKYSGNSIIAFVVTVSIMFGTAKIIPDGTTFDYQEIFTTIRDAGYSVSDKLEDVFDKSFDISASKARDDYFSYSQYGDNSGGIGISNPSTSDRPVLDVVLEYNHIPVYLRGDIGVDFNGTDWSALRDEYENAAGWDKIKDFYPETQYQITRQKLTGSGYSPDDFLPLQKVSVNYRRKTNVVFQPLAPYELDYKESDYFDSFGDTVYRVKGGSLNTYESLALTPNMNYTELSGILSSGSISENDGEWSVPNGLSVQQYKDYISAYENYIYGLYTGTDFNVDSLLLQLKSEGYISDYMSRYNIASGICRYFKENFTYSLTVDNGEDNEILDSFLYETKQGHCALFATSTVLALRSMDIPARYVTGYVVYGSGDKITGGYSYTLRERDLHAWVEVYFDGVGWLPFDPTASVSGFYQGEESHTRTDFATSPPEHSAVTGPDGEPVLTEADTTVTNSGYDNIPVGGETDIPKITMPDGDASVGNDDGIITPAQPEEPNRLIPVIVTVLVIIAALALAVIAVYMLIKRVENAEKKAMNGFRKKNPNRATAEMYKLVMIILDKQGLTPECEMMNDFAVRVDASIFLKGTNVFMTDVMPVFIKCEFGDPEISPVTEEERAAVYKFTSVVYRKYMSEKTRWGRFITKISLFL